MSRVSVLAWKAVILERGLTRGMIPQVLAWVKPEPLVSVVVLAVWGLAGLRREVLPVV